MTCCLLAEKILLEGMNGFLNVLQMGSTYTCAFVVQLYRILIAKNLKLKDGYIMLIK